MRLDHWLGSDVGENVLLYLLIGYPGEQVFVQNLLSVMLVLSSVTRPYAGELHATNNRLILVAIIKMVGCFKRCVSLKNWS
jgi:hypothetical protein